MISQKPGMVFYLIGLGLWDERDVTVRGLEIIKKCSKVYLENYTSILHVPLEKLQEFYGRKDLIVADRNMVESGSKDIIVSSKDSDVAFLVVGDPFGATTHSDLRLRAHRMGVQVEIIHNASIMNAVACCGLQLYRFGQTISMCFWTERWRPDSYYEKIIENRKMGLHTLCLLDIKVKEPSEENLFRGKGHIFEPPRFMTINEGVDQLLQIKEKMSSDSLVLTEDDYAIGMARVGALDQVIRFGKLRDLLHFDFGAPLHCLVIPADLHEMEREVLEEIYPLAPKL